MQAVKGGQLWVVTWMTGYSLCVLVLLVGILMFGSIRGKNLMVMSGLGVFGLKCLVGLRRI
ncbi:hypothetical protein CEP82_011260 [Mobiluncus mulieris]|nr:hypothetical protein CEP82_012110 [Mobiluncus mulieris]PNL40804.1 hypothetical protein CEP82_011945 [Mobiluncus mulieris]PNL44293.1 hypothetical protein CEP82_011260 [Mobiluncus mulieris]